MLYMVQRCEFKDNADPTEGVDANLKMDYMGSSEFEFGALPASLRRIHGQLDQYHYYQHPTLRLGKNPLVVFCREQDQKRVMEVLTELDRRTHRTMEVTYFDGRDEQYTREKFPRMVWWNIDEDGTDLFFSYNPKIRNIKTMIERSIENMEAKKREKACREAT